MRYKRYALSAQFTQYLWIFFQNTIGPSTQGHPSFVHNSKNLTQYLCLLFLIYCRNNNWPLQSIIDSSRDNSSWGVYIPGIVLFRWLIRNLIFVKPWSSCWDSLPKWRNRIMDWNLSWGTREEKIIFVKARLWPVCITLHNTWRTSQKIPY